MTTDLDAPVAVRLCTLLFDLAWKSLAVVMLIGLVAIIIRRASAAQRHLVLSASVYGLLALPLLTVMLPARHMAAPFDPFAQGQKLSGPDAPATLAPPQVGARTEPVRWSTVARATSRFAPTGVEATHLDSSRAWTRTVWPLRIVVLWGLGVGLLLLRMLLGMLAAYALIRRYDRAHEGLFATQARRAQTALGLSRTPRLYLGNESEVPAIPMTTGLLRPAVLLPATARDWPEDRLYAVLLHEMAHIKRGDWLTQMVAMLVCALYWFNPLVWVLAHRLRAESENACDDMALSAGVPASDYAQHLLAIAQALHGKPLSPTLVTMARRTQIHARLRSILAIEANRQPVTARALCGVLLAALAATAPLAIWQTRIEAQTTPPNLSRSKPITAGPREATLPEGVHATLDTVSGPLADGKVGSWYPDGSHLKLSANKAQTLTTGQRRISVRLIYPSRTAASRSFVMFDVVGGRGNSVSGVAVQGSDGKEWDYIITPLADSFPPTQRSMTLGVNVAAEAPQSLVTGPVWRTTTRRLDTGETITLARATSVTVPYNGKPTACYQVKLTLPSRFINNCDYDIVYLDSAGKTHGIPAIIGSSDLATPRKQEELRYNFRASEFPVAKIRALRFQSRPIHTVFFYNVALQPKVDTASVE